MSFDIYLEVPGLTDDLARRISKLADERGVWPIAWRRSRRVRRLRDGFRATITGTGMWIPDETESGWSLDTDALVVDGFWDIEPRLRARFACALQLLGEEAPQGFALMVKWVGDDRLPDIHVGLLEFCAMARSSRISERTRYVVAHVSRETSADTSEDGPPGSVCG